MNSFKRFGAKPDSKLARNSSQGTIFQMFDNSDQRVHGTQLIARQVELENLKARQKKVKERAASQVQDIKLDKRTLVMQSAISQEQLEVERWQKKIKQQTMQNNLDESMKMRELIDIEQTRVALSNEVNMNKKFVSKDYKPALVKPLNIDGEATKHIGAANLRSMFQS
jgi:hypothetical protein